MDFTENSLHLRNVDQFTIAILQRYIVIINWRRGKIGCE